MKWNTIPRNTLIAETVPNAMEDLVQNEHHCNVRKGSVRVYICCERMYRSKANVGRVSTTNYQFLWWISFSEGLVHLLTETFKYFPFLWL
jgi:hypothetical protein